MLAKVLIDKEYCRMQISRKHCPALKDILTEENRRVFYCQKCGCNLNIGEREVLVKESWFSFHNVNNPTIIGEPLRCEYCLESEYKQEGVIEVPIYNLEVD